MSCKEKNLFELIGNAKLFFDKYSYDLYKDFEFNFEIIDENTEIVEDSVFLYEGEFLERFLPYVDEIIVYFWNRDYPFDETFEEFLMMIGRQEKSLNLKERVMKRLQEKCF